MLDVAICDEFLHHRPEACGTIATFLRDAGLSYGDYLEQLTYLIFLKMMHEGTQPPYTLLADYRPPPIPEGYDWTSLLAKRRGRTGEATIAIRWKRSLGSPARWASSSARPRTRSRNRPC